MPRNHNRTMQAFYIRYSFGPWECHRCGELIVERGRDSESLNVHHIDGDVENDDPTNLEPLHCRCHHVMHQKGRPHSPEHNAKVGQRHKGRTFTPEWRQRLSDAQRRRFQREPTPTLGMKFIHDRIHCDNCGRDWAKGWIERHRREGRCVA